MHQTSNFLGRSPNSHYSHYNGVTPFHKRFLFPSNTDEQILKHEPSPPATNSSPPEKSNNNSKIPHQSSSQPLPVSLPKAKENQKDKPVSKNLNTKRKKQRAENVPLSDIQEQTLNLIKQFGTPLMKELSPLIAKKVGPMIANRIGPPFVQHVGLPLAKKMAYPILKRLGILMVKKLF